MAAEKRAVIHIDEWILTFAVVNSQVKMISRAKPGKNRLYESLFVPPAILKEAHKKAKKVLLSG